MGKVAAKLEHCTGEKERKGSLSVAHDTPINVISFDGICPLFLLQSRNTGQHHRNRIFFSSITQAFSPTSAVAVARTQ